MSKEIININGVKMEIDTRQCRRVDTIAVGTRVKVLKRPYDSSPWEVFHGVVIGFEPFDSLPTIIIAMAKIEYSKANIEYVYYNSDSKNTELVVAYDEDEAAIDRDQFIEHIDREIAKAELEIQSFKDKKKYFLDKFKCYWVDSSSND